MTLLESIAGPRDLKQLSPGDLPLLASEIRDVLIEIVTNPSSTGRGTTTWYPGTPTGARDSPTLTLVIAE